MAFRAIASDGPWGRSGGLWARAARLSQPSRRAAVDLPVTDAPEAFVQAMNQVLKPYFLLACVAFVMGFASYLAVGGLLGSSAAPIQDDWQASISAPATPAADAALARSRSI